MTEDYLWDGSGEPDPEIAHLEAVLESYRWSGKKLYSPSMKRCEPGTGEKGLVNGSGGRSRVWRWDDVFNSSNDAKYPGRLRGTYRREIESHSLCGPAKSSKQAVGTQP